MARVSRGALLALVCAAAGPLCAYHHFVQYNGSSSPIPSKFDLRRLPDKTVNVLVAADTQSRLLQPEFYPSALAAIREAAQTWNQVATSDLRVSTGGLYQPGAPQTTPGIDVVFEEMDPFSVAFAGPTAVGTIAEGPNGQFAPIARSLVRLNRDLSVWSGPNVRENFFLTVVHEMGHALGLQHSFTGGIMATEVTRAASLRKPLDDDDIAGISALYPTPGFDANSGTITGRVTFQDGSPVHLASVVAIRTGGTAVSALSAVDGSYRIQGIPPGAYLIYVHPVPPSGRPDVEVGDLKLPVDGAGNVVRPSSPFNTVFYRGSESTKSFRDASTVNVGAGVIADNIGFSVTRRSDYRFNPITTYSYFSESGTYVRPGYLNPALNPTLIAFGRGLAPNDVVTPGLQFEFLGGSPTLVPNGVVGFGGGFVALYMQPSSLFGLAGPRHLVLSLDDDIYIRPNAFFAVQSAPPQILEVRPETEQGTRVVTLTGKSLSASTIFYFDHIRARTVRMNEDGSIVVAVPPGYAGHRATLTAYNADGQNSQFLQSANPATYLYETVENPFFTVTNGSLPAGSESLVEVIGTGTQFTSGQTSLGFGTSDIQVRGLWVMGPNRLLANVWVASDAALGAVTAIVQSGFRVMTQPNAISLQPVPATAPILGSRLVNAEQGKTGVYPGALVSLSGANLAGAAVLVNDQPAEVALTEASRIVFRIPSTLSTGPAILRASHGAESSAVVMVIGGLPPIVQWVSSADAPGLSAGQVRSGELLRVVVSGVGFNPTGADWARLIVSVGGAIQTLIDVTPIAESTDTYQLSFIARLPVSPGPTVDLKVSIDDRTSVVYPLSVRQP